MALFNRFFGSQPSQPSVSRKKYWPSSSPGEAASVWSKYYEAVPDPCDVRVVVFRQCERKGQKLLFDSATVAREKLAGSPPDLERAELYKEQSDGWGYKYLKAGQDVRQLHDMIFGGAGVAHQQDNMKLHQLESSGLMWSSVLQPPHPAHQQHLQASDNSLGSSFGCSIGSFNTSESSQEMFHGVVPQVLGQGSSLTPSDSGYYSSHSSHSCTSFPSLDTDTDLPSQPRRRLSSHADLPDYGSWCSLQRRWLSMVENSLPSLSGQHASCPSYRTAPVIQHDSLSLKSGGRPSTVLGVALIVNLQEGEMANILLKQNLVLEDIFSSLCESVRQAYIHKRRFVSTVYSGYCECERTVRQLYTLPHLPSPAWHLALTDNALQDRLVQDLLLLRGELDTKETNFFFSCLLTGVLSHHLGWVETVMPSSLANLADNSLKKPGSRVVEEFSEQHWYSPTRLQHHELHGILGCPARNVKTLVITETEELARRIVFVLSYFIRCSQILERKLEFRESKEQTRKFRVDKGNQRDNQKSPTSCSSKITNLARSSSSPTLEPKMSKQSMKKSKSFICSLSDMDENKSQHPPRKLSDRDRVNFLIGDNENLNINPHYEQERFDSGLKQEALESDLESLELQDESSHTIITSSDPIITKGVPTRMKAEEEEEEEEDYCDYVELTEVPLASPDLQPAQPAPLASLLCCSDSFMPGSVLQAVVGQSQPGEAWRSSLQADLLATANNHLVAGSCEETICLVGDLARLEVSQVSAQQVVVGRSGLPVPLSPMVANILDTFSSTASFSLPASTVLNQLEDGLQQVYLQSCILAEFLLSQDGFHSLQTISSVLDVEPCDVPLLLSVAATHTPSVGHKYGLSFAG